MENRYYKLDIDQIKKDFNFTSNENKKGLTHKQCDKFKLFPFPANEKTLFTEFYGVTGAFSRLLCDKGLKNDFNIDEFLDNVANEVGEYDCVDGKEKFKNIINAIFIDNDKLVDFNIKTINYISSNNAEEKIARYIYSIFYDDKLKMIAKNHYDKEINNILYRIVLNSLPPLDMKESVVEGYNCYLPFIKEQFIKDFMFLITDEDLYKSSIQRLLEFYYFYYISQITMKLSRFEKADMMNPDKVYFTLSWERTSKNRTSYVYGWSNLKQYATSLFSHSIVLEFLNHCNLDKQLDYISLYEIFNDDNGSIKESLEQLCALYMEYRQDGVNWETFEFKNQSCKSETFQYVHKLFQEIEYQFNGKNSTRKRAYDAYGNWFIKFTERNFGKRRGSLGYSLSLTEEDIILLTKLCINKNKRIKLSRLFEEFEKRGVSFDRDSKSKIIQLYEKLNLLEKKSDSGDAQYVRSVL